MILTLHIGHDATACLADDEIISLAEERITRIKMFYGVPFLAIEKLLEHKKKTFKDVEKIIICGTDLRTMKSYRVKSYLDHKHEDYSNNVTVRTRLSRMFYCFMRSKSLHDELTRIFKGIGFEGEIEYLDHHHCHVLSSFATYPIEDSMLVSLDGGGDGINWAIYKRQGGKFVRLAATLIYDGHVSNSPADIYADTTKFLGFQRIKHEGKLTGLAAHGSPIYYDCFKNLLWFKNGEFIGGQICDRRLYIRVINRIRALCEFYTKGINYDLSVINYLKRNLKDAKKEDVASSLQRWFEDIVISFLKFYVCKFELKGKALLLSGGAFANVLLNQKLKETGLFDNVYVVPNMGDGGLVLGAVLDHFEKTGRNRCFREVQKDVYYGIEYSEKEILKAVNEFGLKYCTVENLPEVIADKLNSGKIVGLFTKRMEFGPRALGARSILANPSNRSINDTLNARLNRTEFMPFAPYFLDVDAHEYLLGYDSKDYSANYMTITYYVENEIREKAPAIVHLDGTARPQIIARNVNPLYYEILGEFKKISGIPTLINTSFNAHEEPIVMSPRDAINSYLRGSVDVLVLDKYIIAKD